MKKKKKVEITCTWSPHNKGEKPAAKRRMLLSNSMENWYTTYKVRIFFSVATTKILTAYFLTPGSHDGSRTMYPISFTYMLCNKMLEVLSDFSYSLSLHSSLYSLSTKAM